MPNLLSIPEDIEVTYGEFPLAQLQGSSKEMQIYDQIDRYAMHNDDGSINMLQTAWVMNALVFESDLSKYGRNADLNSQKQYDHDDSKSFWRLRVDRTLSLKKRDFAIGHELGHIMIYNHIFLSGNTLSESKLAIRNYQRSMEEPTYYKSVEALCDYASAVMLRYA